jgi:hypothetical protein
MKATTIFLSAAADTLLPLQNAAGDSYVRMVLHQFKPINIRVGRN